MTERASRDTSWDSRLTVDLVRAARNRQPEAWGALYSRCADEMSRFCRHFLGVRDPLRRFCETDDILNEAFVLAMEHIDSLQNDACFFAWIRTIVRRRISLKRHSALCNREKLRDADRAALDDFERELAVADDALRVLDAILELFPQYTEAMAIFSYVHFENCSADELVDSLGLSRRTVYRRLEEACRLIRTTCE